MVLARGGDLGRSSAWRPIVLLRWAPLQRLEKPATNELDCMATLVLSTIRSIRLSLFGRLQHHLGPALFALVEAGVSLRGISQRQFVRHDQ